VTGVRIEGLVLVNGRVNGENAAGGCVLLGQDASLHLRNVTFRNCSAPGVCQQRIRKRKRKRGKRERSLETSKGRGGAI
jgi:hypothetical protein